MKKNLFFLAALVVLTVLAISCSRGLSPSEAANGKVKCGRYVN